MGQIFSKCVQWGIISRIWANLIRVIWSHCFFIRCVPTFESIWSQRPFKSDDLEATNQNNSSLLQKIIFFFFFDSFVSKKTSSWSFWLEMVMRRNFRSKPDFSKNYFQASSFFLFLFQVQAPTSNSWASPPPPPPLKTNPRRGLLWGQRRNEFVRCCRLGTENA